MTNHWYGQNHNPNQPGNLYGQGHGNWHGNRPTPGPNPSPNRMITIIDAINIALAQVPGQAVKAELERERGRQVWEVDIRSYNNRKYEVLVDVYTGQVLRVKRD